MRQIAVCIGIAIIIVVSSVVFVNQEQIHQAGGEILATLTWCVRGLATLILIAGVVIGSVITWAIIQRQQDKLNRPKDGSFALRTYHLADGSTLLVNPNHMLASAAVISTHYGYHELPPSAGWDHQLKLRKAVQITHHLQATSPGDDAISSKYGAFYRGDRTGIANAATGKFLAGGWDKPLPRLAPEPEAPPPPRATQPLPLLAALQQSQPDKFILGYNEQTNGLACFNPRTSIHAAIIGASGTGKTESTGMQMALLAIKYGYHLVILDPKGGVDWRLFAAHAEWYETDSTVFAHQMDALLHVHQHRYQLVRDQQVATVFDLPTPLPPILVMIEEYGDLRDQMLGAGRTRDAEHVELVMSKLFRLARMTGIGLVLIDQYPEAWTRQAMTGTKAKFVYQLGPGQGNAVGQYHAQNLPDHGRFIYRGGEFDAWHSKPFAEKTLQRWPLRQRPPILDGVYTIQPEAENEPPSPSPLVAPTPELGPTKIQQAVWAWMDSHPEVVATNQQAPMRSDLAAQGMTISRGYASELWHEYKNKQA